MHLTDNTFAVYFISLRCKVKIFNNNSLTSHKIGTNRNDISSCCFANCTLNTYDFTECGKHPIKFIRIYSTFNLAILKKEKKRRKMINVRYIHMHTRMNVYINRDIGYRSRVKSCSCQRKNKLFNDR